MTTGFLNHALLAGPGGLSAAVGFLMASPFYSGICEAEIPEAVALAGKLARQLKREQSDSREIEVALRVCREPYRPLFPLLPLGDLGAALSRVLPDRYRRAADALAEAEGLHIPIGPALNGMRSLFESVFVGAYEREWLGAPSQRTDAELRRVVLFGSVDARLRVLEILWKRGNRQWILDLLPQPGTGSRFNEAQKDVILFLLGRPEEVEDPDVRFLMSGFVHGGEKRFAL